MGAKKSHESPVKHKGQALLELLIMVPVLLVFAKLTLKINGATQISINNQKALRVKILDLALNSPFYPKRNLHTREFVEKKRNHMSIGLVDDEVFDENSGVTKAPNHEIARTPAESIAGAPVSEPAERTLIRVRSSVGMCTPVIAMSAAGAWKSYSHKSVNDASGPLPVCDGADL